MFAAVFPGQGSQKPGMGKDLAESFPAAAKVFDEVSGTTGIDLRKLCWETDEDTLRRTDSAQLALFTCGVAAWEVLRSEVPEGWAAVAGHSVGEYAALVAAGVFSVVDGALLVRTRGDLMAEAGSQAPGAMAAVLGMDKVAVEQACEAAGGTVVVANDNCPGQLVISGDPAAIDRVKAILQEMKAKRVLPLNVSGAFHSPLMTVPAAELGKVLLGYTPRDGILKVYSNVTSEPVIDGHEWPALLEQQLRSPVRWAESVSHMVRDGIDVFVECGVGDVLGGLIRRIDGSVKTLNVADAESLRNAVSCLI